jgi:TonB family protein
MNAAEIRSDWVGRTVDGRFVLLEWLGGSGNNGVFLTELPGAQSQKAAIKLIAADSGETDRRMANWAAAATLSHPHLMNIFDSGRSQVDNIDLVYFVAEYSEEVLSQIIPERALTPEETREMLDPVIDTLSYLHGKGFVHGHLKPSNIMVVDNRLKLSTDSLLVKGAVRDPLLLPDRYDVPLNRSETITPAVDVWALGISIVEVLTQHPPAWNRSSGQPPAIPEAVPVPFSEIARRCLQLDPARRCTLGEIKALLGGTISAYHEPVEHPHPRETARKLSKAGPIRFPIIPMVIVLLVLLAIIAALSLRSHPPQSLPPVETPNQSPPSAASTPPVTEVPNGLVNKGAIASRALPDVSKRASETIQGTVRVAVRVKVDASGNVSDAEISSPGPSTYFARLALESAHSWKFKPARADDHAVPSVWTLRYQFRSTGTDVVPVEETP